jgi:gliding motility-associated-like protein
VTLSKVGNCDPFTVHVTHSAVTAPITYKLIDTATGQTVSSGTGAAGAFDILNVNSGTYVVEITDGGAPACVSSSAPTPLNQDPPLTVTFDETSLCTNGTLTAVGNGGAGPYTFDWNASPAGSITSGANTATVTVTPGTSWTLQVTVTDAGGTACPGKGTTTILIDQPLNPDFTQSAACADQVTVTATPNGSYLYRWYRDGALDPGLAGPQITADKTNNNQQYQVILYNPANGCNYNSPQKPVQILGQIAVTLTNTFPCVGSPFTITASPTGNVAAYTWSLNGTVISGQTGQTLAVPDGKGGKYTVEVTDGLACTATNSITINPAPTTEGNLSSLVRICPDPANPDPNTRQATLDPGTFQSYEWFKDGVSLNETAQTITVNEGGKYSVKLTNNFGCPSDDQTEVVENCDPVIVGPNAFRPSSTVTVGGDPVNQSFRLFTFFIDDDSFDIFIFNRWGEMVYHSTERDFRWNGGYNNNAGQLAPAGTYTYVVRYKSSYEPERGVQEKRGGVVLLR